MRRKKEEETETHFYVRDEQQRRRFPEDPLSPCSIRLPITLPSHQFERCSSTHTHILTHWIRHAYRERENSSREISLVPAIRHVVCRHVRQFYGFLPLQCVNDVKKLCWFYLVRSVFVIHSFLLILPTREKKPSWYNTRKYSARASLEYFKQKFSFFVLFLFSDVAETVDHLYLNMKQRKKSNNLFDSSHHQRPCQKYSLKNFNSWIAM